MIEKLLNSIGIYTDNQLRTMIKDGATLVDVRSKGEFTSGHPKGAIHAPLNHIEDYFPKIAKDKTAIVFCQSGIRAGQAKSILKENGYPQVINARTWTRIKRLTE